jgi:predicted nucleic acid-binding protein
MTASFRCVLDTNVCIKQFIEDPLTPKVNQLFDLLSNSENEFHVPDFFYIECTNVLWKYVKADLHSSEAAISNLEDLKSLPLRVAATKDLMVGAAQISFAYNTAAYDSCYVALAERINAPLLTLDKRLINSLRDSPFNVQLFTDFEIPDFSAY